ncbi:MAG: M1 family metallopeptidase [Acidobacteria bacterium]|nr:M1 family metallopeptidase [Acidobacteriota bacterium]
MKRIILIASVFWAVAIAAWCQSAPSTGDFDVSHYDLRLALDIGDKSIKGTESIKFVSRTTSLTQLDLDAVELTIDSVKEKGVAQKYISRDRQVIIALSPPAKNGETREIEIEYHATPTRGIRFFPDRRQVYTVFSTSRWMVCLDDPDKRATLGLTLIVPSGLSSIANGQMVGQRGAENGRISYEWRQSVSVPTYTFGFAVGKFRTVTVRHGKIDLQYASEQYSDDELRNVFRDTGDMIDFYEDRAGVKYPYPGYTQVLAAGGVEQEMSGFTALRETYGRDVLADEHAIWLGAHELAHQWWGNMVTNRAWTHFWLNEGMASFMASAYKEHRFGRSEYLRDIDKYRMNYEKVRAAGKDRSLVFPDWKSPTAEDRTLVYDKGAYVIHLLREELGDSAFWSGIRLYTRKYFGKSVTTPDFQHAMEGASKRDLSGFFDEWVYLRKRSN